MKSWLERSRILLVVIVLFCLLANPVMAVSGLLDITPQSILIETQPDARTDTGFTVLNLDASPQNFTVSYIRSTATETIKVLEPRYVSFPGEPVSLPSQVSVDIPFNVSTDELKAGEYQGTIRVLQNASLVSIPVVVKVRDPLFVPVIILFGSAILSAILFIYGTNWRKRGGLRRDSAIILAKVEADNDLNRNEFARFFRDRIITALQDTEEKVLREDYTGAEDSRKNAETYWNRWYTNRPRLLPELDKTVAMKKKIGDAGIQFEWFTGGSCTFLADLQEGYLDFWRDAAFSAEGTISVTKLSDLDTGVVKAEMVLGYLEEGKVFCESTDQQNRQVCLDNLKHYAKTLRLKKIADLDPQKVHEELEAGIPKPRGSALLKSFKAGGILAVREPMEMSAPEKAAWYTTILGYWDILFTLVVPVITLTIIGLYLLYFKNPTFGSLIDYLGLALWGFLSCATNEGAWQKITTLNPTKTAQS